MEGVWFGEIGVGWWCVLWWVCGDRLSGEFWAWWSLGLRCGVVVFGSSVWGGGLGMAELESSVLESSA